MVNFYLSFLLLLISLTVSPAVSASASDSRPDSVCGRPAGSGGSVSCEGQTSLPGSVLALQVGELAAKAPFEMNVPQLPQIPSYTVSLLQFGAVPDGVTHCTEAFAEAFRHLQERGGGHLVVPSGIWLTGPIGIPSHTDLHLEDNAVILFDHDLSLYPLINTSFEGLDCKRCESPVHSENATDVSITGKGTFDGGGGWWRPLKKSKVTSSEWKEKIAGGGVLNEKKDTWYPDSCYMMAEKRADKNLNVPRGITDDGQWEEMKSFLRPVMVSFRSCTRVLIEGCTFQNSPAWNIHPFMCNDLVVNDIFVLNPSWSQNGDGIDIECCSNAVVLNSRFDVGDDAICVKSGKDEDGRRRGMPSRNLIIDGCKVYHGHGGFVVGSEMSGGVENVSVSNCTFLGTDVGFRFKSRRGRGGVVRNIFINGVNMTDIKVDALLFDLAYQGISAVEAAAEASGGSNDVKKTAEVTYEVDETTPQFRDISISNVICRGALNAVTANGLPEMPISGITINGFIVKSHNGIVMSNCRNVEIDGLALTVDRGEPVVVSDSEDIKVNGQRIR